jgi:hypothetical protein
MKISLRRADRRGIMLLDIAVVLAALLLVAMLQITIMHRNAVAAEQDTCRKQMKWIAKAQENYYAGHAQYASTFRELAPFFQNLESFVCPTSHEIYSLYIDDVGRYQLDCQFAGHGGIVSGDPDWE